MTICNKIDGWEFNDLSLYCFFFLWNGFILFEQLSLKPWPLEGLYEERRVNSVRFEDLYLAAFSKLKVYPRKKRNSQKAWLELGRNDQNGIKCLFPTGELHILKYYYWKEAMETPLNGLTGMDALRKVLLLVGGCKGQFMYRHNKWNVYLQEAGELTHSLNKERARCHSSTGHTVDNMTTSCLPKSTGGDRFIQNLLYLIHYMY